ncbi:hypothetical protein [Providencia sneebia]|nr:hypothetical protein [Providencia sneebia]
MFIVYILIVIAFYISLATVDSPDDEKIDIDIEERQIGSLYVM